MMSLIPFPALNVVVTLLSMQDQKVKFHQKYLNCVPKMNEGLTGLQRHEGSGIFISG